MTSPLGKYLVLPCKTALEFLILLKMAIQIAHISDLHFGLDQNDKAAWPSLRTYLTTDDELKPQLILVTGDIVNTPHRRLFEIAATELKNLHIPFFVCAGNHDRHPSGLSLQGMTKSAQKTANWLERTWHWCKGTGGDTETADRDLAPEIFDQEFAGHVSNIITTASHPIKLQEPGTTNTWDVLVWGLDTSQHSGLLAQGYLPQDIVENVKKLKGAPEADLVVMMIHHHLLPIQPVEMAKQTLLKSGEAASTVMVNSGQMLEVLARAQVNLVLHGHDHHRWLARYGTMHPPGGEIVVLGAASATGVNTEKSQYGFKPSFNVIELMLDRRVIVREARHDGVQWTLDKESTILLQGRDMRRAQQLRRSQSAQAPISSRARNFVFTDDRHVLVRELHTNATVENGVWPLITSNRSGFPVFLRAEFEWAEGGKTKFSHETHKFSQIPDDEANQLFSAHGVKFQFQTQEKIKLARRIETEFVWSYGGCVTSDDIIRERDTVSEFRRDGKEFVETRIDYPLETLVVSVELPDGFVADGETSWFETFYGKLGEPLRPAPEFSEYLRVTGTRRATLQIPYPQADRRYVLAWRLPPPPIPGDRILQLRKTRLALVPKILEQFVVGLRRTVPDLPVVLAAYCPVRENASPCRFELCGEKVNVGSMPADNPNPSIPKSVDPVRNAHPFCTAFRKGVGYVTATEFGAPSEEELSFGLQPSEAAMLVLPVQAPISSIPEEPVFLMRVGILKKPKEDNWEGLLQERIAPLRHLMVYGDLWYN